MIHRRSIHGLRTLGLASALTGLIACGNGAPPDTRARARVLAPIETADVVVRESFPPQYAVRIVSGLPGGCASFERIEVERDGSVVELTVWNTVPSDPDIVCTMIYGTIENVTELGSDFEAGRSYDLIINGEVEITFGAQ